MPILFYLENTRVKIFYDIGGIMNLHFKNICRSKVFIISLISIIFIEFISTKSTREVEATTNLNFLFFWNKCVFMHMELLFLVL